MAAVVAMFVLPLLPAWLWEGPRVVRHRLTRHVCVDCGAGWSRGHVCVVPSGHSEVFHRYGELWCPPCEDSVWVEVPHSRVLRPGRWDPPLDQHDRVPVELTRLPGEAVENLREIEERKRR